MTQITKKEVLHWLEAALVRAVRTFAQAAIALIPMGVTIQEVSWTWVLSSAALAAIVSILTSLAGLPEVSNGEALPSIMAKEGTDVQEG